MYRDIEASLSLQSPLPHGVGAMLRRPIAVTMPTVWRAGTLTVDASGWTDERLVRKLVAWALIEPVVLESLRPVGIEPLSIDLVDMVAAGDYAPDRIDLLADFALHTSQGHKRFAGQLAFAFHRGAMPDDLTISFALPQGDAEATRRISIEVWNEVTRVAASPDLERLAAAWRAHRADPNAIECWTDIARRITGIRIGDRVCVRA